MSNLQLGEQEWRIWREQGRISDNQKPWFFKEVTITSSSEFICILGATAGAPAQSALPHFSCQGFMICILRILDVQRFGYAVRRPGTLPACSTLHLIFLLLLQNGYSVSFTISFVYQKHNMKTHTKYCNSPQQSLLCTKDY